MEREVPQPLEDFETWLLQRVARAVEAGEVSGDLLTELRTEIEQTRELPQEEGHTLAIQDIAEQFSLPLDQSEKMLAALEAQPAVARELLLPEFTPLAVPPRLLHRLSGVREQAQPALPVRDDPPRSPQSEL
jgi:hypothetical protein